MRWLHNLTAQHVNCNVTLHNHFEKKSRLS
jgi:hypothetical protein